MSAGHWPICWLLGKVQENSASKAALSRTRRLIEQLAIQARLYGLRTSPALLETEGNGSPMLIGIVHPAIVIPGGTLRKLSNPELAMVLGHELAHIRRGDLLWNLTAAVVRAVFFFNPLVWLSQRRLNLSQEVAADELAILRQNGDPVSYGKLLVSVISKLGPSRLIPTMSMGTAGSVKSLTRRLVAMANIGRASRGVIVASGILMAVTVLLGLVPWRLVAAEPKEGSDKRVIDVKVSDSKKGQPNVSPTYYRIEPPDVIQIEMPRVTPLPSYQAAVQPVTGQYLVGPDGTINLRKYGVVHIGGKTVADARIAIQNQLKQYLDSPNLSLDVVATNSKVYYVITQGPGLGNKVRRLPVTGNETVLDAISQIQGLSQASSKRIWIARHAPHLPGGQQILPIDWDAITQGAQTATNYQILPGDRVYVATPDSSTVKTLPVGNNNRSDTPRNPYQSIPAHPKDGTDKQPVASVKPIPPATPATGPLVLRENQRLAKIEVWERKKGQAKVILNRPQIVFAIGQEAKAEMGNKESRLDVSVRSMSDKKPFQHVIEAKLIHDPEGKNPVTLMSPKLTLADDETGSVIITRADGSESGMEATISSTLKAEKKDIFPDRQSVIDPNRIYDPILTRPTPPRW